MATVFGNKSFDGSQSQSMGGRGGFEYFQAGYLGQVGHVTHLGTHITNWDGRTSVKGVVWNASGVPIATAVWVAAQGTGEILAAVDVPFDSTAQQYRLGFRESTDNYLSVAFGGGSFEGEYAVGGSWASPPTIVPGSETFWSGGEFKIWAEGTIGGGSTVTGSGDLQAQAATLSGSASANHNVSASGALNSQAASISGSATINQSVTSSGALNSQTAAIAGTASVSHGGTGALVAQSATMSGSAVDFQVVTGSGIVVDATSAFLNLDFSPVNGDKVGLPRNWAGSAITLNANGTFTITPALAEDTQVPRISYDVSTDTWYSDTITITITGVLVIYSSGALVSQNSILSGSGNVPGSTSGSGNLAAQSAAISGTATVTPPATASGTLQSQPAAIAGVAVVHQNVTSSGNLDSQSSQIHGIATITPINPPTTNNQFKIISSVSGGRRRRK